MPEIFPIPAFSDNYIWAVISGSQCLIVDPGDAKVVVRFLEKRQLELTAILITHWHGDHTGGIDELLKYAKVPVYGPNSSKIPSITERLSQDDCIELLGQTYKILAVPGHTLDHIAYYSDENKTLFSGDTLFAGGCGRIFEGDAPMLFNSLNKLKSLPDNTAVYCTHEYTESNLKFAVMAEPGNQQLAERLCATEKLRETGTCTLPSSIKIEKETNPFFRCDLPSVAAQAVNQGAASESAVDVFETLREWKNNS